MITALKEIINDCLESLWKHYILWSFILVLITTGLNMELFWMFHYDFFLTDSDSWMRALRITDWLSDFQWSEKVFPWTNPPHGFILHWTRACDVVWAILALPLTLFMPLKSAVFWGGMLFSPLFFAFTMSTLCWGLKPYVPDTHAKQKIFAVAVIFLLFYLNKIDNTFVFHRPDHHSLMSLVFSFNIAVILRSYIKPKLTNMLIAGALSGFGMWASSAIEGLFVVTLMLMALSINWIFYKKSALNIIYYAFGLFCAVCLAWLINPPFGGWAEIDINGLSIAHTVLTGLIFISYAFIYRLNPQKIISKISLLGSFTILSAALMLCFFGTDRILIPIYEPHVQQYFLPRINEMKHMPLVGIRIISVILGCILLIALIYRDRLKTFYLADLIICFTGVSVAATCVMRFFPYYNMMLGVLIILVLYRIMAYHSKSWFGNFGKILYVLLPVLALAALLPIPSEKHFPPLQGPILTDLFDAPEIIFKQGVDTVGSPYHTNVEGIIDNYKMWFTTDENELKSLLKKHKIKEIYLPLDPFSEFYVELFDNTDKLYGKVMIDEEIYPWMDKIAEHHYSVNYDKF